MHPKAPASDLDCLGNIIIRPISGVLRRPEVQRLTGLSKSSIYAAMKAGTFPPAVHLGPRTVGWLLSEIQAWLKNKLESRKTDWKAVKP